MINIANLTIYVILATIQKHNVLLCNIVFPRENKLSVYMYILLIYLTDVLCISQKCFTYQQQYTAAANIIVGGNRTEPTQSH